jgi:hypothetical protein
MSSFKYVFVVYSLIHMAASEVLITVRKAYRFRYQLVNFLLSVDTVVLLTFPQLCAHMTSKKAKHVFVIMNLFSPVCTNIVKCQGITSLDV